jgi:hypothetical protein
VTAVELRLKHLHDDDKNYMIRVCMFVGEDDFTVEGSVVRQCEECDRDIWYATHQKPPVIIGQVSDGEVLLCLPCTLLHQAMDTEPAQWIMPRMEDLL